MVLKDTIKTTEAILMTAENKLRQMMFTSEMMRTLLNDLLDLA